MAAFVLISNLLYGRLSSESFLSFWYSLEREYATTEGYATYVELFFSSGSPLSAFPPHQQRHKPHPRACTRSYAIFIVCIQWGLSGINMPLPFVHCISSIEVSAEKRLQYKSIVLTCMLPTSKGQICT